MTDDKSIKSPSLCLGIFEPEYIEKCVKYLMQLGNPHSPERMEYDELLAEQMSFTAPRFKES